MIHSPEAGTPVSGGRSHSGIGGPGPGEEPLKPTEEAPSSFVKERSQAGGCAGAIRWQRRQRSHGQGQSGRASALDTRRAILPPWGLCGIVRRMRRSVQDRGGGHASPERAADFRA